MPRIFDDLAYKCLFILDIYVSMFTYYTQMMKYINDNPGQVLNLHFEDMKRVIILADNPKKVK